MQSRSLLPVHSLYSMEVVLARDVVAGTSRELKTDNANDSPPVRSHQSVKLPRQLRQRLRLWAAFLDKEISEVVEEAVTKHLDDLERQRAERKLPPLPSPDVEKQ